MFGCFVVRNASAPTKPAHRINTLSLQDLLLTPSVAINIISIKNRINISTSDVVINFASHQPSNKGRKKNKRIMMKISVALAFLAALQSAAAFVGVAPTTKASTSALSAANLPPPSADKSKLQEIFYQNQAWKASKISEDPAFFQRLGSTHSPEFMWIGSADARVPPNVIIGEDAGNVFVHRNIANMVVNTDTNLMSALQYGVNYLKVKHIIVCGNYECEGVRAAEAAKDFVAPLELWLRNVRDVYAKHREELDAIEDADARHRRLVDLNVIQQCVNVLKTGAVQRRRAATWAEGEPYTAPLVHAVVFDPKTGDLRRLDIDFEEYRDELSNVYGLYLVD